MHAYSCTHTHTQTEVLLRVLGRFCSWCDEDIEETLTLLPKGFSLQPEEGNWKYFDKKCAWSLVIQPALLYYHADGSRSVNVFTQTFEATLIIFFCLNWKKTVLVNESGNKHDPLCYLASLFLQETTLPCHPGYVIFTTSSSWSLGVLWNSS